VVCLGEVGVGCLSGAPHIALILRDVGRGIMRQKVRATVLLLAIAMSLFSSGSVNAQTNYPGEFHVAAFNVAADAVIVSASNCMPYSRGCLAIDEPPTTVSYLTTISDYGDVSLVPGYARYFPFSPCLLNLPFPDVDQPVEQHGWIEHASNVSESPWYSSPVNLLYFLPVLSRLSPSCNIARVDWESIQADQAVVGYPNQLAFNLRLGKIHSDIPGNFTAPYGYSGYMGGKRFHEGFDTSWRTDPTANVIVNLLPSSPFLVRGGWGMAITPCELESNMFGARDESYESFKNAMERLEQGSASLDCAILWGGFHIVSEYPEAPFGKASEIMNRPGSAGSTPWELGVWNPAGSVVAICATVSGYAGNFAPHCHYQVAVVPGSIIRRWVAQMRVSPSSFFRSPEELVRYRNKDWGDFWGVIYRYSVDPALFFFPEMTSQYLDNLAVGWADHPWPDNRGISPETFNPSAYWYSPGRGEYIIGLHSPGGAIEQLNGDDCILTYKDVPGCYCRPGNSNYYNADGSYSRSKVVSTQAYLSPVITRYICAKLQRCP